MRAFQISALVKTAVRDERERGIVRGEALEDAARQALEALENAEDQLAKPYSTEASRAITALRAALSGGSDA